VYACVIAGSCALCTHRNNIIMYTDVPAAVIVCDRRRSILSIGCVLIVCMCVWECNIYYTVYTYNNGRSKGGRLHGTVIILSGTLTALYYTCKCTGGCIRLVRYYITLNLSQRHTRPRDRSTENNSQQSRTLNASMCILNYYIVIIVNIRISVGRLLHE